MIEQSQTTQPILLSREAYPFIARIDFKEGFPLARGRAYLHVGHGLNPYILDTSEDFAGGGMDLAVARAAQRHLGNVLELNLPRRDQGFGCALNNADYTIALMWANKDSRMIDFFTYQLDREHPTSGNAEVTPWFTSNGKLIRGSFCDDGTMLLAQEAAYRKSCDNMNGYLRNPPEIRGSIRGIIRGF